MRPDKDHPTNYGLQCIKGLTAAEPMYVDRMEGDPYVRKDVWAEWKKPGHGNLDYISKTKGSFDEEHFIRIPYEQASEMVDHKIAHFAKKCGGNSIGLYGSGQLYTGIKHHRSQCAHVHDIRSYRIFRNSWVRYPATGLRGY